MAEFPTMPLRTDALIGDTMHLTASEFGGYVRLLVAMWRNGATLPDDDKRLMRFAGMTAREWARSKDVILAFLTRTENGDWTQKRLRKEWLAVAAKCEQAARSANARWLKEKETTNADASLPQCERNATHDPVSKSLSTREKNNPPTPRKRGQSDDVGFERFWSAYPRKIAKPAALRAWRSAVKRADAETIIAAAPNAGDGGQFTPHPSTWLNQDRWQDAPKRPSAAGYYSSLGIPDLDGGDDDTRGNFSVDRAPPAHGGDDTLDVSDLLAYPAQKAGPLHVREYVQ